jgi:tRNA pseudouridine55 synthase
MPMKNLLKDKEKGHFQGIIAVDKPSGITAFELVRILRKLLGVKKIGHAGTLDPFATGVMVMLVGKKFTKLSDKLLNEDKEYIGRIRLGVVTDTFDCDGKVLETSGIIPDEAQVKEALRSFQGEIQQLPPMFSAKKLNGKKLYELARKGETVERPPVTVNLSTECINYAYPYLDIKVKCSKGTYIRSLAHDLGKILGCGGYLAELTRTRSGSYTIDDCIDGAILQSEVYKPESLIQNLHPVPETEQAPLL